MDKESDEYKVGFHDGYQSALKQLARVCPDVQLKEYAGAGEEAKPAEA